MVDQETMKPGEMQGGSRKASNLTEYVYRPNLSRESNDIGNVHRAAQPQPNPQTALQEDAESAENLSKEDSSAPLCVLLFNGLGWF